MQEVLRRGPCKEYKRHFYLFVTLRALRSFFVTFTQVKTVFTSKDSKHLLLSIITRRVIISSTLVWIFKNLKSKQRYEDIHPDI